MTVDGPRELHGEDLSATIREDRPDGGRHQLHPSGETLDALVTEGRGELDHAGIAQVLEIMNASQKRLTDTTAGCCGWKPAQLRCNWRG